MKQSQVSNQQKNAGNHVKIPGLWLVDSSGAVKVDQDNIVYCHHYNNITKIVYSSGHFMTARIPLKKIEQKLCSKKFYRCHRNYLINLDYSGGRPDKADTLTIKRHTSVPVSRRRKSRLIGILERMTSGRDVSV